MAVTATAVWRVRPSGSNINGGGYDSGIAGAATDYSQQNAAQATGTLGTAAGTAAFSDAGGAFTAAMIGNALWIASGAGFTTGAYFITAFTSSTAVTLDRSPGTGSAANWKLGGGWADFVTNTVSGSTPIVAGNTVYVLGSGTPNPAAYTYDYTVTSAFSFAPGSGESGGTSSVVLLANDPLTPGYKAPPDTTGGMPTVKVNTVAANFMTVSDNKISGLWFIANSMNAGKIIITGVGAPMSVFGCVFDQFGNDATAIALNSGVSYGAYAAGCEVFSSSGGSGGTNYAITGTQSLPSIVTTCNIHDCVGRGININFGSVVDTIVAKCSSHGIVSGNNGSLIMNCTVDANGGDGIHCSSPNIVTMGILNNIISNHVTGGTFGISLAQGAPFNPGLIDYNVFFNNTTDYSNSWPYQPHDTHGGSNPYVGQSTENYTLA